MSSAQASLIRTHTNTNINMKDTTASRTRRRSRSTSIIHEVQPETVIDESDQSALPNWNSSWVNLKGTASSPALVTLVSAYFFPRKCWRVFDRGLGDSSHHDHSSENPVRFTSRDITGTVMDINKFNIHGHVIFDVPLGQGDTVRVQLWGIR